MLVLTSVMVTVAPGMARFAESLMLPTSDPLTACASRVAGASRARTTTTTSRRILNLLVKTDGKKSADNIVKNGARHVRQSEIAPAIPIGQLGVVDAEQVEDGGVQVVHVDRFVDRLEAEVIRGAVDRPALDAAAGQPHRESEWIVISSVLDHAGAAAHFHHGSA